jgi:hypothetical protein
MAARTPAVLCLLSLATLLGTRPLGAQGAAYFQALAVPPRSMGTCMPVEARPVLNTSVTTSRLVMASIPPGRRREIAVSVDVKGRPVSYSETSFASRSSFSSEGDDVFASLDAQGNVHGWRLRTTSHLSDSLSLRLDSTAFRRMNEHMSSTSVRDPLDADSQRRVLELVKWLRSRCPT